MKGIKKGKNQSKLVYRGVCSRTCDRENSEEKKNKAVIPKNDRKRDTERKRKKEKERERERERERDSERERERERERL